MTNASSYAYFKGESDKEFNIESMRKYVNERQEMDKELETFITPFLRQGNPNVLDAACGIGHLEYFFSDINPHARFLGVDQAAYLIEEARQVNRDKPNVSFETGDILDLSQKYPKAFDLSISWKTLSFVPSYEPMVRALMDVTRGHIFLSSMFYDGDIDYEIKVREHQKDAGKDGWNVFFNVYSLPRFVRSVKGMGAKNVEVRDFNISIDIPRGPLDRVGTYTEKLADGRRLQISGAVVMSWKIIRIDL